MQNVSFIIPNYNAENTIDKCIESVQKQKYSEKIEIIVIDDRSTDNSLQVISKYKNIKLIKNEKNLGLASSLNKAIKLSKYNTLCILWCDCILVNNNWLNEMVKTYNKNKNVGAISSKLIIPKEYWNEFSFYDKVILVKDYEVSLKNKQKEGRPSLFNKKLLFKMGLYDDKTFRIAGEDTDLIWKIKEHDYKVINANTEILHLHGFYNLSFKKQLLKKALPLAEASGVILYLTLLIPYINIISSILIILLISAYTFKVAKYVKDKRIIIVPLFKFLKDIITIIGFWKGFITRKQEF